VAEKRKANQPPSLVLKKGQTIEFPVPAKHSLASCQRRVTVKSLDDLRDFAFVREWRKHAEEPDEGKCCEPPHLFKGGRPSEEMLLTAVGPLGRLLQLHLRNFEVPAGSTVVMRNALNHINATKVIIEGTLEVHGELAITCDEIRGSH
jgi:hypothetical protein